MANSIKSLLSKKGWTGEEVGKALIASLLNDIRYQGQEHELLFTQADFDKMESSLSTDRDYLAYGVYRDIYSSIVDTYNRGQGLYQQFYNGYYRYVMHLQGAMKADNALKQAEYYPLIMTEEQYHKAERETVEEKKRFGESFYSLVFTLLEYFLNALDNGEKVPADIAKAIEATKKEPAKGHALYSRYNELMGEGYYTLEDGRRSDEMTSEEWQAALTTPKMAKALEQMRATDGSGTEYTLAIAMQRLTDRARIIFNGGTDEEADEAQHKADYERGLAVPAEWHYYEDPPADLTKWDIIEQELLLELYPADIDGSGDAYSESNFTASMEDFKAEFAELVKAMLADIDKKHFSGSEVKLSALPVEKWLTTLYSWRSLYEADFYGEKEAAEGDAQLFNGNKRALFNGIAILRPSDIISKSRCIDERGYYIEPDIHPAISSHSLEAFFTESEDYAKNIATVENARSGLLANYYYLQGYNKQIDLIIALTDVPELEVFKQDLRGLEEKIEALNNLVPFLYKQIRDTDYRDKGLQARKMEELKDISLLFRGSSNQRLIDMKKTLSSGQVVEWTQQ